MDNHELQVVFLIDVSYSMSNELSSIKNMITQFEKKSPNGLNINIWTFSEFFNVCFISKSPKSIHSNEVAISLNKIGLCVPHDYSNRKKNHQFRKYSQKNIVAAFVSLLESFKYDENILVFIITDSSPHHKCYGHSRESEAERVWLAERNFKNLDIFYLQKMVIETLKITVIPILYNDAIKFKYYHQAALMSNGLVLVPKSNNLVKGLTSLLFVLKNTSKPFSIENCHYENVAFIFEESEILDITINKISILTHDPKTIDECIATIDFINQENFKYTSLGLLKTSLETTSTETASLKMLTLFNSWNVNSQVIGASLKVIIMLALDFIDSPLFKKNVYDESVDLLSSHLGSFKSNEIKKLAEWKNSFSKFKNAISDVNDVTQQKCVITLSSVLESIQNLEEIPENDTNISKWMRILLELILCRLINIPLTMDQNGEYEFLDPWRTPNWHFELSTTISAYSAMKLRNLNNGKYIDPYSRRKNTAAIILPHPNDVIQTFIYKTLAALPSLHGLLQCYLVTGGLPMFPFFACGIQSSCIFNIISRIRLDQNIKQSEWQVIRSFVWATRINGSTQALNILKCWKQNKQLNPVDNVAKLTTAIFIFFKNEKSKQEIKKILTMLLEEISADLISHSKKMQTKNVLPLDRNFFECFQPKFLPPFYPQKKSPNVLLLSEKLRVAFKILNLDKNFCIADKIKYNNGMRKLKKLVKKCKFYFLYARIVHNIFVLLECDVTIENWHEAYAKRDFKYSSLISKDQIDLIFTESYILKHRSMRYIRTSNKYIKINTRDEIVSLLKKKCLEQLLDIVSPGLRKIFVGLKFSNAKYALTYAFLCNNEFYSFEQASYFLETASIIRNSQPILTLERFNAVHFLENIKNNQKSLDTVGLAFCIAPWTESKPCVLRSSYFFIQKIFQNSSDKIKELLEKHILAFNCLRLKTNRHGHNVTNIFPGISGWSKQYQVNRLNNPDMNYVKAAKIQKVLKQMKNFSTYLKLIDMEKKFYHGKQRSLIENLLKIELSFQQIKKFKKIFSLLRRRNFLDPLNKIENILSLRYLKKSGKILNKIIIILTE